MLRVVHEAVPEPAADAARTKVLAAGVSAFDLMYRRSGRLPGAPAVPFTLGEDIVGVVDAVGRDVSNVEPGQVVAGATRALGIGGGYAEHVCLPESDLVPVPAGMEPAQAVCLVANYLTAHLHLHGYARVRGRERILIHGAAGGIGTALLELGKLAHLGMYGTTAEHHHELVSGRGR
jgi:NADPH2:quinone reductase